MGASPTSTTSPSLTTNGPSPAFQGLLRVTIPLKSPSFHSATIELVSFELPDGTPILYADDVAVGAVTGDVYFSDASDVIVGRVKGSRTKFDTLASSIIDGIRGERTGKLLKYSPDTRLTTVVADKIWFANGVTLSPDEKYALICETFAARVLKVDLTPSLYGKVSVFASGGEAEIRLERSDSKSGIPPFYITNNLQLVTSLLASASLHSSQSSPVMLTD